MLFLTDENYQPNNIKYGFFNIITPFHSKKNDPEANNDESIAIINSIFNCHRLCFIDQKHTNKVILINGNNNFEIADGMVCKKPRLALAILTADCVPILLADEQKQVLETYGVGSGFFGGAKRVSFLINPQGQIAKIYLDVKPEVHAEEVLKDLELLNK